MVIKTFRTLYLKFEKYLYNAIYIYIHTHIYIWGVHVYMINDTKMLALIYLKLIII